MSQMAGFQKPLTSAPADDRLEPTSCPPLGAAIKVLMVSPRFPPSFWGFDGFLDSTSEESMQPPLGLLTIAVLCPKNRKLRLAIEALRCCWTVTSFGPTTLWSAACTSRRMTFAKRSSGPGSWVSGRWSAGRRQVVNRRSCFDWRTMWSSASLTRFSTGSPWIWNKASPSRSM